MDDFPKSLPARNTSREVLRCLGWWERKTEVEIKPLHGNSSSSSLHTTALAYACKRLLFGSGSSTGGLILFAIFSLVMDVFKIGYYSSFYSCLSAIKIMYPIVQAIFVIVQVRWLICPREDAPTPEEEFKTEVGVGFGHGQSRGNGQEEQGKNSQHTKRAGLWANSHKVKEIPASE